MALSLLLQLLPVRAAPLSEADVIRLAGARAPEVAVARAEIHAATARESEARLYPNPVITWEREHHPGGRGALEDAVSITVPVDLSGRRSARSALARSEARSAAAAEARVRSAVTVQALEVFYAALSGEARSAVDRRTVERLEEFVRVLNRRQQEGTASGYESVRLELELELVRNALERAEAETEARRTELMGLLSLDAPPRELAGDFTAKVAAKAARTPPSVTLERAALEQANEAKDGAGSAWVPVIGVQAGLRVSDSVEPRYGYVAGVAVELPLFSRGQDLEAAARARHGVADARRRSAERALRNEGRLAELRAAKAREELVRFESATRDRLERLGRASESSYREGTRSITEVLDAERARAEIEHRRLDLVEEAKRAELAVRAAQGEFE